jgi:uncharacterized protein YcfJ
MRPHYFHPIRNVFPAIAITGAVTLSVCSGQPLTTREKGALAGGAVGAGGGALVGLAVGHPLAGAAIDGVVGAGAGMAIGNRLQNSERRRNVQETD